MFDIGFWELMVIAIMGLVVLGPERLPTAIRTVRAWVNGIKRFSNSVQTELKEELRIHELHSNLKKAEEKGLKNLSPEIEESLTTLKAAAEEATRPYEKKSADSDEPHTNTSNTGKQSEVSNDK